MPAADPGPVRRRRFVRDGHVFEIFRRGPSIVTADIDPSGASMGREMTPPAEAVDRLVARLIAEKVAAGYTEVTS